MPASMDFYLRAVTLAALLAARALASQTIGILSDQDGEETDDLLLNFNMSIMFYNDDPSVANLTLKHIVVTDELLGDLCEQLSELSFIVSACRSEESIKLVFEASLLSGIPTIQIGLDYWNLTRSLDVVPSAGTANYAYIVPTATVFSNVIPNVFPSLDIRSTVTVVFDDVFGNYSSWRQQFLRLPVKVDFLPMAAPRNVREQVKQLVLFNAMYIFLVAKTVNAVHFLEEFGLLNVRGTVKLFVLTQAVKVKSEKVKTGHL
ncbi:unnamed protein product [Heligmosomoides polygyrus]|uniref:ANF_receptor domain-containing protein n=1 Tax=Heligmosomoides polygyrus TaxID=6339 RepID=A0A183GC66_HELPZ|nr:unnamed protein product [Heligmosomoides polygyrus]